MSNKLFREWIETLPDDMWAKKDLSACKLGWDAAVERAMDIVRNRLTQGEALDDLNAMLQEDDRRE